MDSSARHLADTEGMFRSPASSAGQEPNRPAAPTRSKSLAPARQVPDALTAPQKADEAIRALCPENKNNKVVNPATGKKVRFPMRLKEGGNPEKDNDYEWLWPRSLSHQHLVRHVDKKERKDTSSGH